MIHSVSCPLRVLCLEEQPHSLPYKKAATQAPFELAAGRFSLPGLLRALGSLLLSLSSPHALTEHAPGRLWGQGAPACFVFIFFQMWKPRLRNRQPV